MQENLLWESRVINGISRESGVINGNQHKSRGFTGMVGNHQNRRESRESSRIAGIIRNHWESTGIIGNQRESQGIIGNLGESSGFWGISENRGNPGNRGNLFLGNHVCTENLSGRPLEFTNFDSGEYIFWSLSFVCLSGNLGWMQGTSL